MISIFRLTESIEYTSPIRIRVITALMIERMPLCSTYKLSGGTIHLVITLGQRECLHQQGAFSPTTAGTIVVIMGIPVVYILSVFTSKYALLRRIRFLIIAGPSIYHVIIFLYTGGMYICCSYRTSRIRIFLFGYS